MLFGGDNKKEKQEGFETGLRERKKDKRERKGIRGREREDWKVFFGVVVFVGQSP